LPEPKQNRPVIEVQVLVPHLQLVEFTLVPKTFVHVVNAAGLHQLSAL